MVHETSGRTRDGRSKAQESKDDARHEQDTDEAQHAVGRLEACELCKGDALRYGNGDNPSGGSGGRIRNDLLLAVLFHRKVAVFLLLHLGQTLFEHGIFGRIVHGQAFGGADDEPVLLDDDARARAVEFQSVDTLAEGIKRDIGDDDTAEFAVCPVVRNGDGDDHLLGDGILIGRGDDGFARRLCIRVPRTIQRVELAREVAVAPADKTRILRTVGKVDHVLVADGEAHDGRIHLDRVAVKRGDEICGTFDTLDLARHPSVQLLCLDGERSVDLPRYALFECGLRLVVADATDRYDEKRHQRSHEEQFLLNTQNMIPSLHLLCSARILRIYPCFYLCNMIYDFSLLSKRGEFIKNAARKVSFRAAGVYRVREAQVNSGAPS